MWFKNRRAKCRQEKQKAESPKLAQTPQLSSGQSVTSSTSTVNPSNTPVNPSNTPVNTPPPSVDNFWSTSGGVNSLPPLKDQVPPPQRSPLEGILPDNVPTSPKKLSNPESFQPQPMPAHQPNPSATGQLMDWNNFPGMTLNLSYQDAISMGLNVQGTPGDLSMVLNVQGTPGDHSMGLNVQGTPGDLSRGPTTQAYGANAYYSAPNAHPQLPPTPPTTVQMDNYNTYINYNNYINPQHGATVPHHGTSVPHHGTTVPHHGTTVPHHGTTVLPPQGATSAAGDYYEYNPNPYLAPNSPPPQVNSPPPQVNEGISPVTKYEL